MKITITAIKDVFSDNEYRQIYTELYGLYKAFKALDKCDYELDDDTDPTDDYMGSNTTSIAYLKGYIYDALLEKVQALIDPVDFVEHLEQQLKDAKLI